MRVTRPDVFKDHHVVWRWLPLDRRCGSGAVAPKIRSFASADAFFAAGRIADVLIIATQNSHHFEHAMSALYLGYDILLEKPAAESLERCEEIDRRARQLGQRAVPCFELRYTPFYSTLKRLIDSGKLGRVISIHTHEGVEPFHQAHSFVRGHWSKTTDSTPMIVAKCSHDADLLCWLGGAPAVAIRVPFEVPANAPPKPCQVSRIHIALFRDRIHRTHIEVILLNEGATAGVGPGGYRTDGHRRTRHRSAHAAGSIHSTGSRSRRPDPAPGLNIPAVARTGRESSAPDAHT